jgi:hypothetical protein
MKKINKLSILIAVSILPILAQAQNLSPKLSPEPLNGPERCRVVGHSAVGCDWYIFNDSDSSQSCEDSNALLNQSVKMTCEVENASCTEAKLEATPLKRITRGSNNCTFEATRVIEASGSNPNAFYHPAGSTRCAIFAFHIDKWTSQQFNSGDKVRCRII